MSKVEFHLSTSRPTSPPQSRGRAARALALTLTACLGFGACAESDGVTSDTPTVQAEPASAPLGAAEVSALRVEDPPSETPPEFTADLIAAGARAQQYVDEKIAPQLDLALRETSGLSYADLQAEIVEISKLADSKEIHVALERFGEERGPLIQKAMDYMGTTSEALSEEVRRVAFGDAPPPEPRGVTQGGPQTRAGCSTGFEFEPFPPYFQAGNWWWGVNSANLPAVSRNGTIRSESNVLIGASGVGGWVRADNIPPAGAGTTVVTATVSLPSNFAELFLWQLSYVGSGVAVTIETFDSGRRVASCTTPVLDRWIPFGYLFDNRPTTVTSTCSFHHASSSFLTTRVHVHTYGTNFSFWGGFARAVGSARVQSIRYGTCLDG
ncbi:MAG: hypothetical protein R3B48_24470 [Kofleriaceae bacterium]